MQPRSAGRYPTEEDLQYRSGMQKAASDARVPPTYPITSVNNALRLLLLFRDRPRLTLTDASSYLEVAPSTAHRLLAMLAYHDFVRQERGQKGYVAGPALMEIGLNAVRQMDIRQRARPVLEELAKLTEETVQLSRLTGAEILHLDGIESTRTLRVSARTGAQLPAHCTASGKALLAALPLAELHELYPARRSLAAPTPNSITRRRDLEVELEQIRKQGYATNRDESEVGVASVAVAVCNEQGVAIASLSIACPSQRMTTQTRQVFVSALLLGARNLADQMATPRTA